MSLKNTQNQINTETSMTRNRPMSSSLRTVVSIVPNANNTIICYDHWEDGYDKGVGSGSAQPTTEVWGDGDHSNGCAPHVTSCTNANDTHFQAGDFILLENWVDPSSSRSLSDVKYDGRDCIQASKPVAVTRGEYPTSPGSLLAGAVEVLETTSW